MEALTAVGPEKNEKGFQGHSAVTRLFQSDFRSSVVRLERSLDEGGRPQEIAMIADEIIVGLLPDQSPSDLDPIVVKIGGTIQEIGYAGTSVVIKLPSRDTKAYYTAIATLRAQEAVVAFAEPNFFIPVALNSYRLLFVDLTQQWTFYY